MTSEQVSASEDCDSDGSLSWEDFFGSSPSADLVPTLLGMYDALVGRPSQASQQGVANTRPLSVSSIASSTSSSSSSGTSSFCGDGKLLGSAPKSSAYLASIESLEDSDEDAEERHKRFTGSQGSGDSGVYSPSSNISSSCPPPVRPRYCDPHLSYMDRIVMEVIETERIYVHDLQQIIEGYLHRWRTAADCPISEKQLADLFSNIEDIYNFNSDFLRELEQCGLDPVRVARTFVSNNAGFSVYTQYCTNYPRTVSVLTELMRQEGTVSSFRERQSCLHHTLPLGSYLLKPVQRILKYHLLLQNIVKNSSNEAEGYADIVDALSAMTGIAHHINNMKRRHEHAIRVQEIQSLLYGWEGEDLTTYGELCAEGTFRMSGAKALRHVFLFDKMLLITKKKEEAILGYKAHIMCSNLMLIESVPGEPFSFHAIPFDNPRVQYTLQARNLEQKREWTLQLKRVILENYNVVIPSHARQLVMELGQSRTDDEIMAEKSTPKRQHSAPEYLEKRKQERQRRKSETGLRYRLHRSRKSEARSVGKGNDQRERRASSSSCDRSQSRDPCLSTPTKIKERFGSWRRKSEPGCYSSSAPASPSPGHSKLSIAHDDGSLNAEAGLVSPEVQPDISPADEVVKINTNMKQGKQVVLESDSELANSKDNVYEGADEESKTLEDIVGQLLMENIEFQKILKRQQRHLTQRNRWVAPGVAKHAKDETSDDDDGTYEKFASPSPGSCNAQGQAYRAHRHAHMKLLRNEHKILSSRRNVVLPDNDGDYVTLMYRRQSHNVVLQVPGQKCSPCALRSTKSADVLLGDAILADKGSKSSIWVQNEPRLEDEEQEGFGNYDNLERIWETVRRQQEEIQVLANGVENDNLSSYSAPPPVLSPNVPAVWLKQQGEHLAVSTQKSGSLPRSFQVGNETDRSSFRPRLLTRDGKPCSDRPFTIASDKPQEINFDDIERYIEQSGTARIRNRFPLHGDTTEEDSTTEYATTPNQSLDELNVHPDYKIYRPSMSLKYMISSVSSKLASLRASSETLDAETETEKMLRRERRASKFVHAFARQYGNMLRQRIRNIVGEETEEIYDSPNSPASASISPLPIYKQGSSSLGARIAHCSDYANPRILFPNIGQKSTSDVHSKSHVCTASSSGRNNTPMLDTNVCHAVPTTHTITCQTISNDTATSPSSEDFNVSDGSADSYYERSFEAIESMMETDVLRDSAVFSDQEDMPDVVGKSCKIRPPVPAKPDALRLKKHMQQLQPEERLVRGLEGISKSVCERRRELEQWKASREDDASSQHSTASTVIEVKVVDAVEVDAGGGGSKGWVRHVIGKLQGDVGHTSLKHT